MTFLINDIAPSNAPENISVVVVSSTSIEVSWTPPPAATRNGVIREYRISVVETDTGGQQDYVAFMTNFVVQSLHPAYTYHISVSAYTVETGPYSTVQVLQTLEDGMFGYSS